MNVNTFFFSFSANTRKLWKEKLSFEFNEENALETTKEVLKAF